MANPFTKILGKEYASILFNILFAIYIYFLSPLISSTLTAGTDGSYFQKNYLLGTILILAVLADTILYPIKLKIVITNLETVLSENKQLIIFFIGIFRIGLTYGMFYVIFESFGYEIDNDNMNPYFMSLILIGSMRDMVYGIMPGMISEDRIYLRPYAFEKYIDFALMLFMALIFTVISNMFKFEAKMIEEASLALILIFPLVAMVVLPFIYWPSRIPYFIEDLVYINTWKKKLIFFLSNYAIMLSIFYN